MISREARGLLRAANESSDAVAAAKHAAEDEERITALEADVVAGIEVLTSGSGKMLLLHKLLPLLKERKAKVHLRAPELATTLVRTWTPSCLPILWRTYPPRPEWDSHRCSYFRSFRWYWISSRITFICALRISEAMSASMDLLVVLKDKLQSIDFRCTTLSGCLCVETVDVLLYAAHRVREADLAVHR